MKKLKQYLVFCVLFSLVLSPLWSQETIQITQEEFQNLKMILNLYQLETLNLSEDSQNLTQQINNLNEINKDLTNNLQQSQKQVETLQNVNKDLQTQMNNSLNGLEELKNEIKKLESQNKWLKIGIYTCGGIAVVSTATALILYLVR